MRRIGIALVFALFAFAGPAQAADRDDVMAVVDKFMVAFNAGDTKGAEATCLDDGAIIDEFPPYEWHGPGVLTKWLADYAADSAKNGITEGTVKLGKAKHVDVSGDRAYVVTPADYTYRKAGKTVKQKGSMMTIVLKKDAGAWKIAAWSWARN